ncbi:MAG: hypothetical protein Kow0069_26960 [Promethearchaeota archaeon]
MVAKNIARHLLHYHMAQSSITVRVEPDFNWEECVVRVDLRAVSPDVIEGLEAMVTSWYKVGALGGYRDIDRAYTSVSTLKPEEATEINYLGSFNWDGKHVEFFVDLGSAGDVAIDILLNLILAFSVKNGNVVRRVWIGFPGIEEKE